MAHVHPNFWDSACVGVCIGGFALAATVTSFRLVLRIRSKHWWWDDWFALISMISMTVLVAGFAILGEDADQSGTGNGKMSAYYMSAVGYYTSIWAARLSILFTIIRIAPWARQRKILLYFTGFFVFQWTLLMIQVFWVCEISKTGWERIPGEICVAGKAVAVSQILTTVISDSTLVLSPLWILRKLHVSPGIRLRIISVFSVSAVTTVAALTHSIMVIVLPGPWEGIFGAVEVTVALTLCNTSVVFPAFARTIDNSERLGDNQSGPIAMTIMGSNHQPCSNTMLSTLRIISMTETTLCVDMATPAPAAPTLDQPCDDSLLTAKGSTSGDQESFETPVKDYAPV